ncbi:hypothetical protein [Escherichia phage ZCEC13]|uniref:Uncharacterized protein n=1 Tax=Escherichia phage ZCEC13 TaxID=2935866 RepID=A0AAE9HH03_9CAUD|nr:hypothetical protein [Escherichia phage ZCEC13]
MCHFRFPVISRRRHRKWRNTCNGLLGYHASVSVEVIGRRCYRWFRSDANMWSSVMVTTFINAQFFTGWCHRYRFLRET